MFYHLSHYFKEWGLPGSGLFTYVSFRSLLALMVSLVLSFWLSKKFITYMKRKRHIEKARDEEIDPYGVKKKGVPSMGGVVIIASMLVPVLLLGKLSNVYIILLLVTLVWFGLLGFYDDWKKLKGDKDGLRPRYKLLGQFSGAREREFSLAKAVEWLRAQMGNVPVLTGLPFGHVPTKVLLPVGARVDVDVQGREALLLWGHLGHGAHA